MPQTTDKPPSSPLLKVAIDFRLERARHAAFLDRPELLRELDHLLLEKPGDRVVVVTGGPGMGKTALLARWLALREITGDKVPYHFIRRGFANWDNPAALVGSLIAQIEARFPEQREPHSDAYFAPAERLAQMLSLVSERELVPQGERLVIVIDGLDEYDGPSGSAAGDPLAEILPYTLSPWVSLFCTCRPRPQYIDALAARGELSQLDLDGKYASDNRAIVRALWGHAAHALGLDMGFVESIVERAAGNLQYSVTLRQQLAGLTNEQRRIEDIPIGLKQLLRQTWERLAADPLIATGLGILCATRGALTLDELATVAEWTSEAQRRAFVQGASELLIEAKRDGSGCELQLHHDSIRAYIAGAVGAETLKLHHRALAKKLATWPPPREASARRYALRYAIFHRAEAGDWTEAWRIARDVTYLETRCRELSAQDIEAEVVHAASRCREAGDAALCAHFSDLARALSRESHWLQEAPAATTALIWNRLRQFGWNSSDLDQQLRIPANTPFLRVRHVATRENPAFERDLVGHSAAVCACTVTTDGRVISASEDHTLRVWSLFTGEAHATLRGHSDRVSACAVTPNDQRVISASWDGTLDVWDLSNGQRLLTLVGHADRVIACVVMPDGRRAVSASWDGTLNVWALDTGASLAIMEGHTDRVTACAVMPDGRVISASLDRTLRIWDAKTGGLLETIGHEHAVISCLVPCERQVVSASEEGNFRLWNLRTAQSVPILDSHTQGVTACSMTPDGQRLVSASLDRTLRVWDLRTERLVTALEGHTLPVNACAITPDGRRVISASNDQILKIWYLETKAAPVSLEGHTGRVSVCAVTPDGRRAVSGSEDGTLKLWDTETGARVATLNGHTDRVNACAVSPDGRRAVSASWDHTLRVWNLETGTEAATLEEHAQTVTACAITPDGRRVVSASTDRTLKVWDLESAKLLRTLEGHTQGVSACAVMRDERVVSASSDRTLKLWNVETGAELNMLVGHTDGVNSCAVTSDARRVVSASEDATVRVWHPAGQAPLAVLPGHAARVGACAVSPDGRYVVAASGDGTLNVWNLETAALHASLKRHAASVTACAITPDSEHVVSVSDDRTLKVWELKSGECLFTHRAEFAPYTAFAATQNAIVAGDNAGAVWFLDWPLQDHPEPSRDSPSNSSMKRTIVSHRESRSNSSMKHTILLLAANPPGTERLPLDQEAKAIQTELERSGSRERFELVTRWAVEPIDVLRELRRLRPTIVHFSGHGGDLMTEAAEPGFMLQGVDGRAQPVSAEALAMAFEATDSPVQLVVFNACYSEPHAKALATRAGCVVGMRGTISDGAARNFAIGFYGGLGDGESVATAYKQGCAAIALQGLLEAAHPRLETRPDVDAAQLVFASDRSGADEPNPAATPQQTPTIRDELLTQLSTLLAAQFAKVLFRARVPIDILPGGDAPQSMRAMATIQYFEQRNGLAQLAEIMRAVTEASSG